MTYSKIKIMRKILIISGIVLINSLFLETALSGDKISIFMMATYCLIKSLGGFFKNEEKNKEI